MPPDEPNSPGALDGLPAHHHFLSPATKEAAKRVLAELERRISVSRAANGASIEAPRAVEGSVSRLPLDPRGDPVESVGRVRTAPAEPPAPC